MVHPCLPIPVGSPLVPLAHLCVPSASHLSFGLRLSPSAPPQTHLTERPPPFAPSFLSHPFAPPPVCPLVPVFEGEGEGLPLSHCPASPPSSALRCLALACSLGGPLRTRVQCPMPRPPAACLPPIHPSIQLPAHPSIQRTLCTHSYRERPMHPPISQSRWPATFTHPHAVPHACLLPRLSRASVRLHRSQCHHACMQPSIPLVSMLWAFKLFCAPSTPAHCRHGSASFACNCDDTTRCFTAMQMPGHRVLSCAFTGPGPSARSKIPARDPAGQWPGHTPQPVSPGPGRFK